MPRPTNRDKKCRRCKIRTAMLGEPHCGACDEELEDQEAKMAAGYKAPRSHQPVSEKCLDCGAPALTHVCRRRDNPRIWVRNHWGQDFDQIILKPPAKVVIYRTGICATCTALRAKENQPCLTSC